jgi:hypothetical protein
MKQKLLVLVATLLALFFASSMTARPAFACGCGGDGTEEEAWATADMVFIGKVTRAGSNEPPSAALSLQDYSTTLEVQSVLKGRVGSSITFWYQASCTYPFQQGATYRVYARGGQTTICSGNSLISGPYLDVSNISPGLLLLLGIVAGTLVLGLHIFRSDDRRHKKAEMLD